MYNSDWEHYESPASSPTAMSSTTKHMSPFTSFAMPPLSDFSNLSSPSMSRSPSTASTCSTQSTWSCADRATSRAGRVETHLSGCDHCDGAYRSQQRENHDLRKQMGVLRAQLSFAHASLAAEQAKQEHLSETVADLTAALDEVRARSLDVLEENLALRVDTQRRRLAQHAPRTAPPKPARIAARPTPDGDISPLTLAQPTPISPLDRQLAAQHPETTPPARRRAAPRPRPLSIVAPPPVALEDRRNAISPARDSFFARSLVDLSAGLEIEGTVDEDGETEGRAAPKTERDLARTQPAAQNRVSRRAPTTGLCGPSRGGGALESSRAVRA